VTGSVTNPDLSVETRKVKLFEITLGKDIFVGDIIKLQKFQTAPCDMLILGSSDFLNADYIARVEKFYQDGRSHKVIKEAIKLTKASGHWIEKDVEAKKFIQRLTANVEFSKDQKTDCYKGSFKLKSDPKMEDFGEKQIIRKGAILRSEFVYGLVLMNGRNCLNEDRWMSWRPKKTNAIEEMINSFNYLLIVVSILLSFFTSMLSRRIPQANFFFHRMHLEFFTNLSSYILMLPLSVNLVMNTFYLLSSFSLRNRYRGFNQTEEYFKIATHKKVNEILKKRRKTMQLTPGTDQEEFNNSFKVLNPSVIPDLGCIDDVFFDKTGTLISAVYQIRSISVGTKIYNSKNLEEYISIKDPKINQVRDTIESKDQMRDDLNQSNSQSDKDVSIHLDDLQGPGFNNPFRRKADTQLESTGQKEPNTLTGKYMDTENDKILQENEPGSVVDPQGLKGKKEMPILKNKKPIGMTPKAGPSAFTMTGKTPKSVKDLGGGGADGITEASERDFIEDFENNESLKDFIRMLTICHTTKRTAMG
jgi:magnesium-transporting ATPase (P-type)